jgi:hypothetical protein
MPVCVRFRLNLTQFEQIKKILYGNHVIRGQLETEENRIIHFLLPIHKKGKLLTIH